MRTKYCIGIWACLAAAHGWALDATVSGSYTAEYASNVARTDVGKVSDWIHHIGGTASAYEDIAGLDLAASYYLERRMYQDGTYPDETVGTGTGRINWSPIVDRWNLYATNTLTRTTIDRSVPDAPSNQQNVSYTNFGTDVNIPTLSTHYLFAGANYGITNASRTNTDSDRYGGDLGYAVQMSPTRLISVRGAYNEVDFTSPLATDYSAVTGSADLSSTTRLLELYLSGGYTSIDRDGFDKKLTGFVGGFTGTWFFTESSSLSLTLSQDVRDNYNPGRSVTTVSSLQDTEVQDVTGEDALIPVDDATDTTDIFRVRTAALSFNRASGLNTFGASVLYDARNYEQGTRSDEHRWMVAGNVGRSVGRGELGLNLSYENIDFVDDDRNDDIVRAGAFYALMPWERLALRFTVWYEDRTSSGATADYTNWRALATLQYRFIDFSR